MTRTHDPRRRGGLAALALAALAAGLAGCGQMPVGPNYQLPTQALAAQPGASAPFAQADAALYSAQPLPAAWWKLYDDARLDSLVQQALAHNTDLRQAVANLARERALEAEVAGAQKPTVGVNGGVIWGHPSGLDYLAPGYTPPPQWETAAGLAVSLPLDWFGQLQRQAEAAQASREAAEAATDLARVQVAAGTTRAYAEVCALGLQLRSARHSVQLQDEAVTLTRRLQSAGRTGVTDVARAQGQLEHLRAAIPPLQARRQGALYRLATLTGALPQALPAGVADCETPPQLSGLIPVGDGAALLRRRPDVRQAERQLAAATARIGVATADLYPHIRLGLSVQSASPATDFLGSDSVGWSLGPLISWTLPNTGAVQARIAQAEAGTQGGLAHFDGTVLTALRETETALNAYARELDRRAALRAARAQEATVAEQAQRLYQSGRTGYLPALDAQRALAAAEAELAASEAALADDQALLFLALGGGWQAEAATPPAAPQATAQPGPATTAGLTAPRVPG
ncbi:efflux transporter outer membrane subunit [Ideonella dechloratans]|uniref:efflux transporter outer membrane subunit n=1 Tax=Ideonella dechloratans TaxID=36863 RepID=UPI0035B3B111